MDLLWPHTPPARALHALQVSLSDLRATLTVGAPRALGRYYVARVGDLYRLEIGQGGSVDAEDFERAAARGRAADAAGDTEAALRHLTAADTLYGGDFLADEPYAEWAIARRERLREDHIDVLSRLGRLHEDAARLEIAVRYSKRILQIDPYLEPSYRNLMRQLKDLGDHAGVVRAYLRCEQAMRDGFDSEVTSETRGLARRLLGTSADSIVRRHEQRTSRAANARRAR
jgi:DNA-binding SARP family transcriptional activator